MLNYQRAPLFDANLLAPLGNGGMIHNHYDYEHPGIPHPLRLAPVRWWFECSSLGNTGGGLMVAARQHLRRSSPKARHKPGRSTRGGEVWWVLQGAEVCEASGAQVAQEDPGIFQVFAFDISCIPTGYWPFFSRCLQRFNKTVPNLGLGQNCVPQNWMLNTGQVKNGASLGKTMAQPHFLRSVFICWK